MMAIMPDRSALPPRLLVILYLAVTHLALGLAFAGVAVDARAAAGFFYHARMLALVHLVTLGWITASILGSLYLVGPIALRMPLPAGWADYSALGLVATGITGMVTHFWIQAYGGMGWSGITVAAGIAIVGWRHAARLRAAKVPAAVRLHVALAFANMLAAAVMGILLGFNKVHPFLPGSVLTNVYAHAHLAAVGWAAMMVVGVGYRLLPMVLPAAMPPDHRLWLSAALLQGGVSGLFVSLVLNSRLVGLFAVIVVMGFAAFLAQVLWMARHRRPRPPALRRPDPAVVHAIAALLSLIAACGLGLWLSVAAPSPRSPRIAMAYGVFGLIGFLAQMVVAMEGRLLPLFAWYWAAARAGGGPVPAPAELPWRPGQWLVVALWLTGLPALAAGLAFDVIPLVRAAAWFLLAATVLDAMQVALIVRVAWTRN